MASAQRALVYVSYAWGEKSEAGQHREAIVNELCDALSQDEQIDVGRDKKLLKTGDSIKDFAAEIARGGLILAVISRKSLRSVWCMVEELLQAFRCRNFDPDEFGSDVLALLLDDATDDLHDLSALVTYWHNKAAKRRQELEAADPQQQGSDACWRQLREMEELPRWLPGMIHSFAIRVMPQGEAAIRQAGFEQIRQLVARRLREKSSVAYTLSPSRLPAPEARAEEPQPMAAPHWLAIVLRRQHEGGGEAPEPLYSWQAYLNTPGETHYKPLDLPLDLGPYLIASTQPTNLAPSASGLAAPRSLADLMQGAVDWVQAQPFLSVLEVVVPVELLDVDWGGLPILDRRKRNSPPVALVSLVAYALRSLERFEEPAFTASREWWMQRKYARLARGAGQWLAGPDAAKVEQLEAAETNDALVALKRLTPLEADRELRLRWLEAMVIMMAPVALWRRQGQAQPTKAKLLKHLDGYGDLLAGHNHKDPVSSACAHLERLAMRRREMMADPLVRDVVFLLDHPGRAPGLHQETTPILSV